MNFGKNLNHTYFIFNRVHLHCYDTRYRFKTYNCSVLSITAQKIRLRGYIGNINVLQYWLCVILWIYNRRIVEATTVECFIALIPRCQSSTYIDYVITFLLYIYKINQTFSFLINHNFHFYSILKLRIIYFLFFRFTQTGWTW
jgi:hypothetical protein